MFQSVGQVLLREHESDFSQYSLSIMVKFREDAPLQQLSGTRQSGGERSVSTAYFLLALQSLTKFPFRVVDEINQGMDAINERKLFTQISSSSDGKSQYFLMTPKLLTNLEYKNGDRVLCVYSGRNIQSEKSDVVGQWDTNAILKAVERQQKARMA